MGASLSVADRKGKFYLMTDDPRLPEDAGQADPARLFWGQMPRRRQPRISCKSANLALKEGHARENRPRHCLLHDIANSLFIKSDHGYWGAALIEPYVDEEISWAIRAHQSVRFFPDESVGYSYPEMYVRHFGADYQPDEYVKRDFERAKNHKWYMTARMITVHDLYSFDPNVHVTWEPFVDIIGRHFKQPEEGLGFDNSPSAFMWRTIRRPTKYL